MDIELLKFPSGRSVGNCRKDADRLSAADSKLTHNAALDKVAVLNGSSSTWASAIDLLRNSTARPAALPDWPWGLVPLHTPLMTQADLDKVIDEAHELTANGIGVSRRRDRDRYPSYNDELLAGKEELRKRLDECNKAMCFLSRVERRKTISRSGTSYGLKHSAERLMLNAQGAPENYYLCNGAFIAAATHLGFITKQDGWSPNVCLNISQKSPIFTWLVMCQTKENYFSDPRKRREQERIEAALEIRQVPQKKSRTNF